VKITLESNIALGVQQTLGLLEQQTSLIIAMEFLFLQPANFSSNRNVSLHACSLGPPWTRQSSIRVTPFLYLVFLLMYLHKIVSQNFWTPCDVHFEKQTSVDN